MACNQTTLIFYVIFSCRISFTKKIQKRIIINDLKLIKSNIFRGTFWFWIWLNFIEVALSNKSAMAAVGTCHTNKFGGSKNCDDMCLKKHYTVGLKKSSDDWDYFGKSHKLKYMRYAFQGQRNSQLDVEFTRIP